MRYVRKPIMASAIQWTGNNLEEVRKFLEEYSLNETKLEFIKECDFLGVDDVCHIEEDVNYEDDVAQVDHYAEPGDYILINDIEKFIVLLDKDDFERNYTLDEGE